MFSLRTKFGVHVPTWFALVPVLPPFYVIHASKSKCNYEQSITLFILVRSFYIRNICVILNFKKLFNKNAK